MDSNKYSVDDILEEIKRKKMAKHNNTSSNAGLSSAHYSEEKSSVNNKNFFPQEEIHKPISTVSTIPHEIEQEEDVKIYSGTKIKKEKEIEIEADSGFASLINNEPKPKPMANINSDYKIDRKSTRLNSSHL